MQNQQTDVLLVGGGIMSATLGLLLHQLDPSLSIILVERLSGVALESSAALNNAGTGHAGNCELNYTPQAADGSINISRALEINAAYELSLLYWSHLVETGTLPSSEYFINKTPHLSLVFGEKNSAFLKQRFELLSKHHLFENIQFTQDFAQLQAWMPLMMQHRNAKEHLAATQVECGSDVDFGALTQYMVSHLGKQANFTLLTNTQVKNLDKAKNRAKDNTWHVHLKHTETRKTKTIQAKFVFIGAGGGALPLLQKADIDEAKGYGGFPVSGQWLICNNSEVIKQHRSKVYGKAAVGAPPMSVPHLDTRTINGQPALLFGPFAGFTTKFLKEGSKLDFAKSLKANNFKAMLSVGKNNMDLTKYLIKESKQTHEQRMEALRVFLPQAKSEDWTLENAGQRVQIIKNAEKKWGKLEFGTEIIAAKDGTLAALLGASPGASTSVQAMLGVIERCFAERLDAEWQQKLKQLIPSYGESLIENADLLKTIRKRTQHTLKLG
ncbi:MAG: malate dehydrogenase (quinone) [Methylophilaceae bacterium]